MSDLANFVRESTLTLGTGTVVLEGPLDAYASFAGAVPVGMVWYCIEDGLNRESGKGTFNGTDQLVRTQVHSTLVAGVYSNAGQPITLTGYATVSISLTAETIAELDADIAAINAIITANIAAINTVAAIADEVVTVAEPIYKGKVEILAEPTYKAEVGVVAESIYKGKVETVATNIASVNTTANATNLAAIIDAPAQALAASNSATAASTSASTATTQASNASGSATSSATGASTATTQATTATTQAGIATTQATTATTQAGIATTQATNAATSATNAAASESGVSASATTATTQAGIATTQAGIATTQATTATTQASTATTKASEASVSAASIIGDVAAAQAARDTTLGYRDTTLDYKNSAEAAATSATTTAAALTGFDLALIAESKAITAVDVFVYDTSKDSDGGAWRKRTQATSWYNETLSTATRGNRKEFPSVAVIVAEAAKVTIYDGDDPALPMWRVEAYTGLTLRSVATVNGLVAIAAATGLIVSDYPADALGSTTLNYTTTTTPAIVHNSVTDVAITVLPNAPIDSATGLPVPTIAVATLGGVSVIKDDGTVVDITSSYLSTYSISHTVSFLSDRLVFGLDAIRRNQYIADIPSADSTINHGNGSTNLIGLSHYATHPTSSEIHLLGQQSPINDVVVGNGVMIGTSLGLNIIKENLTTPSEGSVAYITSDYNTGYMVGDIKGAWLSNTVAETITGSGELVTNGTFDTDISGWVSSSSTSLTWESNTGNGRLVATATGTQQSSIGNITGLIIGKSYVLRASVVSGSIATYMYSISGGGWYTSEISDSFIATSTTRVINIYQSGAGTGYIDNISLKLVELDRSVKAKGLTVHGTITKSPVATGSELVGYSGFSGSNYLEQPYNSDLNFGTGDFSFMGWVNNTSVASSNQMLFDSVVSGSGLKMQLMYPTGYPRLELSGSGTDLVTTTTSVTTSTWTHIVAKRTGSLVEIVINGEVAGSLTSTKNVTKTAGSTIFGIDQAKQTIYRASFTKMALFRISATAPSASQIKEMYEAEKPLFQENAACTLYGTSSAVTALAHDSDTDLLHVGTSSGRSVFQGLRRVSNTTTAVGTAISAVNGLIVEE